MFASWRDAVVLIVALAAEAAYVSVLNDLTDRADDRAAGKTLRPGSPLLLVVSLVAGGWVAYLWRHDPLLVAAYGGGWVAFSRPVLDECRAAAQVFVPHCSETGCPILHRMRRGRRLGAEP